jgi:hypothetical protein
MKLCFVSVNGPREPYILDEPRISRVLFRYMWSLCMSAKRSEGGGNWSGPSCDITVLHAHLVGSIDP